MTGYAYSRRYVEDVLIAGVGLPPSFRVIPHRYLGTPLDVVPRNTRFCSGESAFAVLYASPDFATAFIETVARDRFTRKGRRGIPLKEVAGRAWIRVEANPDTGLTLLDLRKDGCFRLGAPTDAANARNHTAGRALARTIHSEHGDVDGLLFSSRLTGKDVYAILDRGLEKGGTRTLHVPGNGKGGLLEHSELEAVLSKYDLQLLKG